MKSKLHFLHPSFLFPFFVTLLSLSTFQIQAVPSYFFNRLLLQEQPVKASSIKDTHIATIEQFLQETVPGLDASYREVLDSLIETGMEVYIRGGAIRDLLMEEAQCPNDLDINYTGTLEQVKAVLDKHQWRYTHIPGKRVIVIGDEQGCSIDALPIDPRKEKVLEFKINSIIYDSRLQTFLSGYEEGFQDVLADAVRFDGDDWEECLYGLEGRFYGRFFRLWKMVGGGYLYTIEMENFFKREMKKVLATDSEAFHNELEKYFSWHFENFTTLYQGAAALMGYEWAQEHIFAKKEVFKERSVSIQQRIKSNTHYFTK